MLNAPFVIFNFVFCVSHAFKAQKNTRQKSDILVRFANSTEILFVHRQMLVCQRTFNNACNQSAESSCAAISVATKDTPLAPLNSHALDR